MGHDFTGKIIYFFIAGIFALAALVVIIWRPWAGEQKKSIVNQARSKNQAMSETQKPIFEATLAGSFYPGDARALKLMLDGYFKQVGEMGATGAPQIIIAPHAGYIYSGQVAAYAYSAVRDFDYEAVIVAAPSHQGMFDGIAIYPQGFWRTPLGLLEIDEDISRQLISQNSKISYLAQAFNKENALETQLPFIQTVLPKAKAVLMLLGNPSQTNINILAQALRAVMDKKNILLVLSSDLSHYPAYQAAEAVDKATIEAILSQDVSRLDFAIEKSMNQDYPNLVTCACGEGAIKVGMILARERNLEGKLLKYANSGDVSGDHSQVVGYASIAFFDEEPPLSPLLPKEGIYSDSPLSEKGRFSDPLLNKEGTQGEVADDASKKKLLEIARQTLEKKLRNKEIEKLRDANDAIVTGSAKLNEHLGAFVTLKNKGELRGCIGRFSPTDIPLYQVVQQMAMAAATEDTRFEQVTYDELPQIEIEISVLSNLTKINDWHQIELGKHGVEVVQGSRRGVFLPQVATENNWDLETFMNELCEHKAGIERDAWRTGEAEIYVFTAEVFSEKEIRN